MNNKDFNFTIDGDHFIVEAEGCKLRVSLEEELLSHTEAMAWCKEHGGGDETVENLRLLARYREQINDQLESIGEEPLGGWVWSNESCYHDSGCAFVVSMRYGDVICNRKINRNYVRAIYILPPEE